MVLAVPACLDTQWQNKHEMAASYRLQDREVAWLGMDGKVVFTDDSIYVKHWAYENWRAAVLNPMLCIHLGSSDGQLPRQKPFGSFPGQQKWSLNVPNAYTTLPTRRGITASFALPGCTAAWHSTLPLLTTGSKCTESLKFNDRYHHVQPYWYQALFSSSGIWVQEFSIVWLGAQYLCFT